MKNAVLQIKKLWKKSVNVSVNKIFVKKENEKTYIYWNDGTLFYKKEIENLKTDFNFSIDLKNAYDIFSVVKNIEIIKVDNEFLYVNEFKLKLTKIEENFDLPDLTKTKTIIKDLKLADLKNFATATGDFRYNNVLSYIDIKKNELAVTDGNRLNVLTLKTFTDKDYLLNSILVLKNMNKVVNVLVNDKYICVNNDNEYVGHLIKDGQFPQYRQLIPQNKENKILLTKEFFTLLKNIKNCVNEKTNIVVFDFTTNKIKTYKDNVLNEFDYNFNFNGFEHITFNYKFLVELGKFINDELELRLGETNLRACVVNYNDKTTVLMPIQYRSIELYKIGEFKKIDKVMNEIKESEEQKMTNDKKQVKSVMARILDKLTKKVMPTKKHQKKMYVSRFKHFNPVSKNEYSGNANLMNLDKVMTENNYTTPQWVGNYQASKLHKQVKKNAVGIDINIFYEKEDGTIFHKVEKVYNIAELEPIQKVENTEDYKEIVKRLKAS